ncbi:MAG: hypothetical protein Fur0025_41810 [Oscillatoriaceae cyanobacterium]
MIDGSGDDGCTRFYWGRGEWAPLGNRGAAAIVAGCVVMLRNLTSIPDVPGGGEKAGAIGYDSAK